MNRWFVSSLISVLVSISSFSAFAEDEMLFHVDVLDCPETEFHELNHLIMVETSAASAETVKWITDYRPGVVVQCAGEIIELRLLSPDNQVIRKMTIDRNEPVARDIQRYTATALVELISATASIAVRPPRMSESGAEVVESGNSTDRPIAVAPHPSQYGNWRWNLGALLRGGSRPFKVTYGASIQGEKTVFRRLSLAGDLQFSIGTADAALGRIRQTIWSGAISVLSIFTTSHWAIRPGIGFRGGQVFWKGEPASDADTIAYLVHAPWGGPFIALLSSRRLSAHAAFTLNLEVGYTIFEAGALVDKKRELSVSGMWFGLSAGLGQYF